MDLFKPLVILPFRWERKGPRMDWAGQPDEVGLLPPALNPGAQNYAASPPQSRLWEEQKLLASQGSVASCLSPFATGFASAGPLVLLV